ncbi:TPA: RusA family crossover junction endodeoxyribonuclease [Clostridium perfringens]|nr:RusA family crossover junction endodeoxyribonuclease [Clostridium perfringens]MCX0399584.1 RusA family crossover junction endodeoxyribonuclease [Clostridium perfringens]
MLDSLNDVAYKDDSQIIELSVIKIYTEELERVEFKFNINDNNLKMNNA